MGSTRLPGKVLKHLAGRPVLEHVVERVGRAHSVNEVIVVTTMNPQDLPIVAWCASHGIRVSCGSEDDVLDRFYQAARHVKPDALMRFTADCPLMDPTVVDSLVSLYRDSGADYANNVEHETYPDGLDGEIFSLAALERAWKDATLQSEREHVTPYIRHHPELFKIRVLDHEPSLGGMRWTLDQQEDFDFLSAVYAELGTDRAPFGMREVIDLLCRKPEVQQLNGSIVRNEGYLKSLREDRAVK